MKAVSDSADRIMAASVSAVIAPVTGQMKAGCDTRLAARLTASDGNRYLTVQWKSWHIQNAFLHLLKLIPLNVSWSLKQLHESISDYSALVCSLAKQWSR